MRIDRARYGHMIQCKNRDCPGDGYESFWWRRMLYGRAFPDRVTLRCLHGQPTDRVSCEVCGYSEPRFVEVPDQESASKRPGRPVHDPLRGEGGLIGRDRRVIADANEQVGESVER